MDLSWARLATIDWAEQPGFAPTKFSTSFFNLSNLARFCEPLPTLLGTICRKSLLTHIKEMVAIPKDSQIMINHAKSVVSNTSNACIIVDIPYQAISNSPDKTYKNVSEILTKSGACAVKLEGGSSILKIIEYLIKNKIAVMGHLGILPQSVKGKFKFKGKKIKERNKIFNDAKLLQDKGVFSIVLECVETTLAKQITKSLKIPTIGIGSSHHCDGQVLVTDDLIGLNETKIKFVKKFVNVKRYIKSGLKKFSEDVKLKKYPSKKYSY